MEDKDAINFISKASLWEFALKIGLDKLEPKTPFSEVGNISAIEVFRSCLLFKTTCTFIGKRYKRKMNFGTQPNSFSKISLLLYTQYSKYVPFQKVNQLYF